jgi:hypothetical protein
MKTIVESGVPGVHSFVGVRSNRSWKFPFILAVSAAAVIGLLLLTMYQRTENRLLKMHFVMQDMQVESARQVQRARRELTTMTAKFNTVESDIQEMRQELNTLRASTETPDKKTKGAGERPGHRPGRKGDPEPKSGLEDLIFSGEVHLSTGEDDPTAGFTKGELL